MKKLTKFFALLLTMYLPMQLLAQHDHNGHENSNTLEAGDVNMDHSLYHMDAVWTSHREEKLQLSDFAGKPVVVVMYYGNCTQVCPILIRDANRLFQAVDESLRSDVRVLAVTFDPENDTPEKLNSYAREKELNIPEWNFITGRNAGIRELAMLLGVDYSRKRDGHFAHSNLVTLLDGDGKIIHRMEGLNQPVDSAAELIHNYLEKRDYTSHSNH